MFPDTQSHDHRALAVWAIRQAHQRLLGRRVCLPMRTSEVYGRVSSVGIARGGRFHGLPVVCVLLDSGEEIEIGVGEALEKCVVVA